MKCGIHQNQNRIVMEEEKWSRMVTKEEEELAMVTDQATMEEAEAAMADPATPEEEQGEGMKEET